MGSQLGPGVVPLKSICLSAGLYHILRVETQGAPMLEVQVECEDDGRWIAEVPTLPGVLTYGATRAEAYARAVALAFRVIADRIDSGEPVPAEAHGLFAAA
jgi:predicted RNase H-like HicB family nuclease